MQCEVCGKELPDGIIVCESCKSSILSAQKTNKMAMASLVVSIAGLMLGFGIVAVIFGIIGQNQITASMGRQKGGGMAIAGIVIGCLGIIVLVIQIFMGAYLIPIINDLEH